MPNVVKHRKPPYKIALVHGGPGAAGEMAAVARELSHDRGVLEPLQTENTVEGQVEELRCTLENHGDIPVILAGFSWGAWLSFIFTARYPSLVSRLILISSPPFTENYAAGIMETRLSRLSTQEKEAALALIRAIESDAADESVFVRFGDLMKKADAYDLLPGDSPAVKFDRGIFQRVWPEAAKMRASGELLRLGVKIRCPVTAIHGDYDSHPAAGVKEPLSRVLKDFNFFQLKQCGHYPWLERKAKNKFYRIINSCLNLQPC